MLVSITSIFLLIAVGFVLRHLGIIKHSWLSVLNSYVYYVALPALIVLSIGTHDWTRQQVTELFTSNLLYLAAFACMVIALTALLPIQRKSKALIILISLTGNTVYLGIPLVNDLVGGSLQSDLNGPITAISVVQLVVALIITLIMFEIVLPTKKNLRSFVVHIAYNPLVVSSVVGLLVAIFGGLENTFGDIISNPISMVATTASPIALLALGGFLHDMRKRALKAAIIVPALLLRLVISPIIAFAAVSLLVDTTYIINSSVLMAAMPVAVTAFVLADQYKLAKDTVAFAILLTTILSLGTIFLTGVALGI